MVRIAEHPQPEVVVDRGATALALLRAAAPGLSDRLTRWRVERDHFVDATAPGVLSARLAHSRSSGRP